MADLDGYERGQSRLKFLCYNELTMSDTQEKQSKPNANQQKVTIAAAAVTPITETGNQK